MIIIWRNIRFFQILLIIAKNIDFFMKTIITNIKVYILKGPKEKRPHWVSNFIVPNANELLVILETNQGVEGFGLATSYTYMSPIVYVIESGISEKTLGCNPP